MRLSVIIPCYNETHTIDQILDRVLAAAPIDKEVIVVDDRSTDGTREKLERRASDGRVRLLVHDRNQGKGAALRTGFRAATGDLILVQDADLEYDPLDHERLIAPILEGKADVVYGSRFLGHGPHRVVYYWHYVGNTFLTMLSNIFSNINLTDMETCYKVFRRDVLKSFSIEENRFGFEPEITAKVAKNKWRIYEVGISYHGRTYEEGKKITWRDGLWAIWCILKYNLL